MAISNAAKITLFSLVFSCAYACALPAWCGRITGAISRALNLVRNPSADVIQRLNERLGVPVPTLEKHRARLKNRPELLELMRGKKVRLETPDGQVREVEVFADWGHDALFQMAPELWKSVGKGLPELASVYAKKLNLPQDFLAELLQGDKISVADSGWVMVREVVRHQGKSTTRFATVKITYFDRESSPNSPWPRYALVERGNPQVIWAHHPKDLPVGGDFDGEMISVQSSLMNWGILPVERHLEWRIAEHEGLFDMRFLLEHRIRMEELMSEKADPRNMLGLLEFRRERFPEGALEVGELGRYTIPGEMGDFAKAQVLYGLAVLCESRPIHTFYAEAPIVERDLLRRRYEKEYGLGVKKTHAEPLEGLPNGAHAMAGARRDFFSSLKDTLDSLRAWLLPEQHLAVRRLLGER